MLEGLASWRGVLRDILQAPKGVTPQVVFYDSTCSYTHAALTGATPRWQIEPHRGQIRLPQDRTAAPTPYAMNVETGEGESFVMIALPSIWAPVAPPSDIPLHQFLEGVLFHEFTHAYQIATTPAVSIQWLIDQRANPAHLTSGSVQQAFEANPAYVRAYQAERDILFEAATAPTTAQAQALTCQALTHLRTRRAQHLSM